ncbi:MAG: bifunctional ornithine acetyltransferase/N-acetylglutamate synthase [Deltaproteobacteria bacterium RBG_16_48_10]|nr:MAG: bifunctional ornithine acetyltransferase/N-acetylglutamate synthase [Deltaproteobacteria bacterium RBG_16_48_10]
MKTLDFKVSGFLFSGVSAGIKKSGTRDLGLIYSEIPAQVAGLFTKNLVKAAPVQLDMKRIRGGTCQAVMINSGNANACTGSQGLRDAQKVCSKIAKGLKIDEGLVLICSTGVIGVPLPVRKIEQGIPELVETLSPESWMKTVQAIMTTDTFPKVEVATCRIKGKRVKLCGMVKGAGMICPDLATMLSFLVTDANIKTPLLRWMLHQAAEKSFNRITVDGETSTNDTVLLLANGRADHSVLYRRDREAEVFLSMLSEVCQELAKSIVKDGEGATKFIEIMVQGARNEEDARKAAYAIAHSPLVKTAFFGEDANWGRILSALGHSGVKINPDRIDLFFDKVPIVRRGIGAGGQWEEKAGQVLKKKSFKVIVDLHQGKDHFSVFTTDLSIDYVRINGSYRS